MNSIQAATAPAMTIKGTNAVSYAIEYRVGIGSDPRTAKTKWCESVEAAKTLAYAGGCYQGFATLRTRSGERVKVLRSFGRRAKEVMTIKWGETIETKIEM